jgi:hypothetical protein
VSLLRRGQLGPCECTDAVGAELADIGSNPWASKEGVVFSHQGFVGGPASVATIASFLDEVVDHAAVGDASAVVEKLGTVAGQTAAWDATGDKLVAPQPAFSTSCRTTTATSRLGDAGEAESGWRNGTPALIRRCRGSDPASALMVSTPRIAALTSPRDRQRRSRSADLPPRVLEAGDGRFVPLLQDQSPL